MERGGVRQLLVRLWWRLRQKSIVGDKPPLHQQPGTEVNGRDTPSNPEVLEARLPMGLGSAMSRATNAILTPHVGRRDSDPEIDSVNKFLRETDGGGGKFVGATEHAGGSKQMECRVYLSAFNHADTAVTTCSRSSTVARQRTGPGLR